jgi:hypothetical protein
MDKELIDEIARSIHRQHAKEMLGALQKWEKLSPDERSTWRLIARSTIALVQDRSANPKRKTEARRA